MIPAISKVGGDASHGSHRAVAPMRGVSNKFLPTRPQAADVGGFVDGDLDSGGLGWVERDS